MNIKGGVSMKAKQVLSGFLAFATIFGCNIGNINSYTNSKTVITASAENQIPDYSLWDRFIKYDLRITDYDSLSEKEKELCKFIFETERSSEDTIICERARRILNGYDVGERVNPKEISKYYNIIDRCGDYWEFTPYPNTNESGINTFLEDYGFSKEMAVLDAVPDIKHIDDNMFYNEYWVDDERTASIEIHENSYYSSDKEPFIYKVYNNDSYESYEIEKNLETLPVIEYKGCKYQICPDNTLALYSFDDGELDYVEIPETVNDMKVTGIKMFAFNESNVRSVKLPETINYIEPFAFYKCRNLSDINLPENLKSIGGSGFCECTGLVDINIYCPNLKFSSFSFYQCSAENVIFNTKNVPDYFTSFFTEYKSIVLGNNVKEIGCTLLNKDIEIPESVKIITWGEMPSGVTIVPKHIEILGAYKEAIGSKYFSVSIGGDAVIPLIENKSMTEMYDGTIGCYLNTEAYNYAIAHNAKFQLLDDTIYGDANGDGIVDIADVVCISVYVSNPEKNIMSEQNIKNSDVHNTGNGLDANDSLMIQHYLAGIIDTLLYR